MAKKTEDTVVEAVGVSGSSSEPALSPTDIQDAMSKAAADAQAEGVTDPEEIRNRMLAARKALKS